MKTLVIILGQIRAHELTYQNIKNNLIDRLNADLAICTTSQFDSNNPFFTNSLYKFIFNDENNYYKILENEYYQTINNYSYQKISNTNILNNKIFHKTTPNTKCFDKNINYLGQFKNFNPDDFNDEILVHFNNNFNISHFKNTLFSVNDSSNYTTSNEENVDLYKKRIDFSKFNFIFNKKSFGIRIFLHWFLLKNLKEQNLINKYDKFIITRSDFIFKLPHPQIDLFDDKYIWFPDGEHYRGLSDRHVVIS